MSSCNRDCHCAAGETSFIKTVVWCAYILCFESNILLELLVLALFVSQELALAGGATETVNAMVGGSVLVQVEAILKATSKMLTASISRLLMKRSMILKTSIMRRMKSWTKLLLLPKPRGRTGFQLG